MARTSDRGRFRHRRSCRHAAQHHKYIGHGPNETVYGLFTAGSCGRRHPSNESRCYSERQAIQRQDDGIRVLIWKRRRSRDFFCAFVTASDYNFYTAGNPPRLHRPTRGRKPCFPSSSACRIYNPACRISCRAATPRICRV